MARRYAADTSVSTDKSIAFGEAVRQSMALAHEKGTVTPLLAYMGGTQ